MLKCTMTMIEIKIVPTLELKKPNEHFNNFLA